MFDCSLIIPFLNEEKVIPALIKAISAQSVLPKKVIFINAGSTDKSVEKIKLFSKQEFGKKNISYEILLLPGGYPGANRNLGITESNTEWVAFLDCGVIPEPTWLAELISCVNLKKNNASFGLCVFDSDEKISKIVCALSYGVEARHPVLPSSLINKVVFKEIGLFNSFLRSAEDVVWMKLYEEKYGKREICHKAITHYRYFPNSFSKIFFKWYIYQKNTILAGLGSLQATIYFFSFILLISSLFINYNLTGLFIISYLLLRGVCDPIRRSSKKRWWGRDIILLIIAPLVALTIDLAKIVGFMHGIFLRLFHIKNE